MTTINLILLTVSISIVLLIIFGILINSTRNFFTRFRYVRLEQFNEDLSITVKYIKKQNFNKDNVIMINPEHVFNLKGYTTIILTSNSAESINPLDFESKYDADLYKTAISNNLIEQTFNTLKTSKLDLMKILLFANFATIALLIYMIMKNEGIM